MAARKVGKSTVEDPVLSAWCDARIGDLVNRPESVSRALRGALEENVPGAASVRKSEATLTNVERASFLAAIDVLRSTFDEQGVDVYSKLVQVHANMAFNMHGGAGEPGRSRFLGWHRVYLRVFERLLQGVDPRVTVPCWEWTRDRIVPPFLLTYLPMVVQANGLPHQVVRGGCVVASPSRSDVHDTVQGPKEYGAFTDRLEGHHNWVHTWVGGSMGLVSVAPADPVFWLHHAEVDRLWHVWQTMNPDARPRFARASDSVMTPWSATYDEIHDVAKVGYRYADATFDRSPDGPLPARPPSPKHLASVIAGRGKLTRAA